MLEQNIMDDLKYVVQTCIDGLPLDPGHLVSGSGEAPNDRTLDVSDEEIMQNMGEMNDYSRTEHGGSTIRQSQLLIETNQSFFNEKNSNTSPRASVDSNRSFVHEYLQQIRSPNQ